jgi:hypothetical protein
LGLAGEAFHRGVYDFLKDFQSAIIGAVAFGTAIWAAKPVFGQLQAARRRAAVVAYEALAEASLIAEQVLFDDIRLVVWDIGFELDGIEYAIGRGRGSAPDSWRMGNIIKRISEGIKVARNKVSQHASAAMGTWASSKSPTRDRLRSQALHGSEFMVLLTEYRV